MVRSSSGVEKPLESYLKPQSFLQWKDQIYRILSRDHRDVQVESVPGLEPHTFKIGNYPGPLRFTQKREEEDDHTESPAKPTTEEDLVCAR